MKLLLLLGGVIALVLLIVLEGRRQERALRRRGVQRGARPSLIGTGLLELQAMLEPERKVETIQAESKDRDRHDPAWRLARPADVPEDPGPGDNEAREGKR